MAEVFETVFRNGACGGFLVPEATRPGAPGARGSKRIQNRSRAEADGNILAHSRMAKRKFRLNETYVFRSGQDTVILESTI